MSDWRLTPQNTALVVVDVQERLMAVMQRREETIAGIVKLISAARVMQIPVVLAAQYVKGLGPVCQEILAAAPEVTPLEKLTFSCGDAPALVQAVKTLGRQRLLVCGVEAHVCVQQTVIDFLNDYFVYVPADAICSRKDLDREVAIQRMHDCGAVITTIESAIFELLREAGTEQFKACRPLVK